ncbi:hypothetical protein [Pseudomonas fulva]|nr:hypothetical protein [Pseudomonas fulva]MBF8779739.1 hypothetical protein [Pseudomonas fulva]
MSTTICKKPFSVNRLAGGIGVRMQSQRAWVVERWFMPGLICFMTIGYHLYESTV